MKDRLTRYWTLDDEHNLVEADNLLDWAEWHHTADRHVGFTRTKLHTVSTVFLGIDHRLYGDGPPITFETMVFADDRSPNYYQERYSTWSDAEAGHAAMVRRVERAEAEAVAVVEKKLTKPLTPP